MDEYLCTSDSRQFQHGGILPFLLGHSVILANVFDEAILGHCTS